jgi:hypothetical protein
MRAVPDVKTIAADNTQPLFRGLEGLSIRTPNRVHDTPPFVDLRMSPAEVVETEPTATTIEELDHAADRTSL